MTIPEALMIWPGNAGMSAVLWLMILMILAYVARVPAHKLIISFTRVLHSGLRLAATSIHKAEQKLSERNREVLLAAGQENAERAIEREFERIDATVREDLAEYPSMHRDLGELISKMDNDYKNSGDVPPDPPGWTKAVDAIAKIPTQGDPMVGSMLKTFHSSLMKVQENALKEYRKSSHKRHQIMKKIMPQWSRLGKSLRSFDKHMQSMLERSKIIDDRMKDYEEISRGSQRAVRMLSSSSLTQFFIAAFVLAVAVGGAMINFNLIARPMAEMVGGSSMLMGFKTANIAALVIILVEIVMGLFLMESLRITRLFPVIGSLDDRMRVRMIWITFSILFTLASVEAGLAYMREILAQDDAALRASLLAGANVEAIGLSERWITTAAQMGMGFILPFALTFVAIPLESFIHSVRTVLGMMGVSLMRILSTILRIFGNIAKYGGITLVNAYDLLVFAPLWIEKMIRTKSDESNHKSGLETRSVQELSS